MRLVPGLLRPRAAVWAAFLANGMAIGAWAASVPPIQRRFGLDAGSLGLVLLALAVGAITAMVLAGGIVGRLGSARVTLISAGVLGIALPLPLLAPTAGLLALGIGLIGLVSGTLDVAMNAQATEVERLHGRPLMSSFHAGWSIGGLLGAVCAGQVGLGLSALPVLALALGASLLGGLPDAPYRPVGEARAGRAPRLAWPRRSMLGLCLLAGACMLVEGAMADWSGIYMRDFARAPAALGFAAFSLAMTAGRLGGDALVRRTGMARTVRGGGLVAAGGVALALAWPGAATGAVGCFLVGLGLANVVPVVFSAAGNSGAAPPATAIAMVSTIGYGGFLLGPPGIGFLAGEVGLRAALLAVVAACLATAFLARTIRPYTKPL